MNSMEKRLVSHILSLMNLMNYSYEDRSCDVIELLEILLEDDGDE
tara:strand:+ start:15963 stop:16097 length:135 start_codon:yes stop_codon:yes gene_type:complete